MSESSSYGESSYRTNPSIKKTHGESSYSLSSTTIEKKSENVLEDKPDIQQITKKLKSIESFVSKELIEEEKKIFRHLFRQIIINNEKQLIQFHSVGFFISKFEDVTDPLLSTELKNKIITHLEHKQNKDKQNNSQLKYW